MVLDRAIAERGRYPPVNVLRSVSRTMPDCNTDAENAIVDRARRLTATYEDMPELIRLGAYRRGSDADVDEASTVASNRVPSGRLVSAGGGLPAVNTGTGTGAGEDEGVGGTISATGYPGSLSAMASMSATASVLGKRVTIEVWWRIASRTRLSRRMTPSSGGENLRNPSHALCKVL